MRNKNILDTHMLLKIILKPNIYLNGDSSGRLRGIREDQHYVYVDVIQFIQDNILELVANPRYICYDDMPKAMSCIEDIFLNNSDIKNVANLERVYTHFCKMLFMVNLMLIRRGYTDTIKTPESNNVRVMPTMNTIIVNRLNESNDNKIIGMNKWLAVSNLSNFNKFFKSFENDNNSWIYTVFGAVLQEYPKSISLLNRKQVVNTILNLRTDEYLNSLAQAIYLNHKYGMFVSFSDESFNEDLKSEVILIEKSSETI